MPHCIINSTKSYKCQGDTFAVPLLMVLFRKEAKGEKKKKESNSNPLIHYLKLTINLINDLFWVMPMIGNANDMN